jgi:hypothetical protein
MHEEVLLVYLANVMCIAITSDTSAKLNIHFSGIVMCLAQLNVIYMLHCFCMKQLLLLSVAVMYIL